ncbi:MAG: hypothetical protein ACK4NF_03925 [Planctomycetota bacterium]
MERRFIYALRLYRVYPLEFTIAGAIILLVGIFSGGILVGPFMCGFYRMALNGTRHIKPRMSDLFSGFDNFFDSLIAGLFFSSGPLMCFLISLIVALSFQKVVVGYVYLSAILLFMLCGLMFLISGTFFYLIFGFIEDRNYSLKKALKYSFTIVKNDFASHFIFFSLTILSTLIGIFGFFALILMTFPLSLLAQYFAYLEIITLIQEETIKKGYIEE